MTSEEKYAICDDCKNPIKSIFKICDYVDEKGKEHCVCPSCIQKFIERVGKKLAEELIIKNRKKKIGGSSDCLEK